jgi:adenosylcobinamide kinase/adenosylcobinamide-phosphate guanylyltransferase
MDQFLFQPGLSLVTGSAWTGKSRFVAASLQNSQKVLWISTGNRLDPELKAHLEQQDSERPKAWTTSDGSKDPLEVINAEPPSPHPIVIDSLSLWLSNIAADSIGKYSPVQIRAILENSWENLLPTLTRHAAKRPVVVLTSDLGASPAPSSPLPYELRRSVGLMNQSLGRASQNVILVTCGLGLLIK